MLISEYISKDFPAFEVDSSAEEALEIAAEFGFTHVFVQKNNLFLGGICKEFLEENPDKNLEELLDSHRTFCYFRRRNRIRYCKINSILLMLILFLLSIKMKNI